MKTESLREDSFIGLGLLIVLIGFSRVYVGALPYGYYRRLEPGDCSAVSMICIEKNLIAEAKADTGGW